MEQILNTKIDVKKSYWEVTEMDEILFLGTGAADWIIEERGEFFRRNSAALLNSELMIDCGEHIFDFAQSVNNADLYKTVTDIIITHNHSDHFCKESVIRLADSQKIRVGCDKDVCDTIGEHPNIEFVVFTPFDTKRMSKYEITPLLANHDVVIKGDSCAFHYIINTPDGKNIFYGLDGAWFLRPSWEMMKKHKFKLMVFDCTVGDRADWRLFEHNTIPMLRMMIEGINSADMLDDNALLVATHLAMTLHNSHKETEKILKQINMLTAYDGMKVIF